MKRYLSCLFVLVALVAKAQIVGSVAQNFGSFPGFNLNVRTIALQPDGKTLIVGEFASYNGETSRRIIRLNTDGTADVSFVVENGFNSVVNTIALQPDGKIVVGGDFTSYNGVIANRIIRLNADGSKDVSFNSGTGFNPSILSIAVQSDGKILVGGHFSVYNGVPANRIIRLNADGTKDNSFITGSGFNNTVNKIAMQPDGKILIVGNFTMYNGVAENRIIRLNANGTKDNSFNTGAGFNFPVFTIAQQPDGKILVGGFFNFYNGGIANMIIRLNSDATKDTSFNSGTGFNNTVSSIDVQTDGKILVGGNFTAYNGIFENRIIRLDSEGVKDTSFISGDGFENQVTSMVIQSDGKIIIVGDFLMYNSLSGNNRVIRLNTNGTKDTSYNEGTGFNKAIYSIAQQPDGKILVGGEFTSYNGMNENNIIRLSVNGTKDTSFNSGITGFSTVRTVVIQSDEKILVGGFFSTNNGANENNIIRLNADGTKDTSFTSGTGFDSSVFTIVKQPDGKILVGGAFTSYNGVIENRIVRLNTDGSKDISFNSGTAFDTSVRSIALQTDGKILVGGFFNTHNNVTENRIVRLNANGTKDTSFLSGIGFDGTVLTITLQSDGKILVGGTFTTYNGVTENRIIRLNTDGTKDLGFNTGTGFNNPVYSIIMQSDAKILIGGAFSTYDSVIRSGLIRLNTNGTNDTSFISETGFNNWVHSIVPLSDGKILAGGNFTSYNGSSASAYLIAVHSEISLSLPFFSLENSFVLYPNPVSEVLYLQNKNNIVIKSIKIIDLQGKIILENTEESINVSTISNGIYIIKVDTEAGVFTKRFIKN